jgi:hypothetical protein
MLIRNLLILQLLPTRKALYGDIDSVLLTKSGSEWGFATINGYSESVRSSEALFCAPLSLRAGDRHTNRHRGESHLSSPATPPDMRVRIRRFGGLS